MFCKTLIMRFIAHQQRVRFSYQAALNHIDQTKLGKTKLNKDFHNQGRKIVNSKDSPFVNVAVVPLNLQATPE